MTTPKQVGHKTVAMDQA